MRIFLVPLAGRIYRGSKLFSRYHKARPHPVSVQVAAHL